MDIGPTGYVTGYGENIIIMTDLFINMDDFHIKMNSFKIAAIR